MGKYPPLASRELNPPFVFLQDMLAAVLLLALVHDLQELLDGDTTVSRDIALTNDLIDIGLNVNKVRRTMWGKGKRAFVRGRKEGRRTKVSVSAEGQCFRSHARTQSAPSPVHRILCTLMAG